MNQAELISNVAELTDLPKAAVKGVLEAAAEVVRAELKAGGDAIVPGLGKLSTKTRPARVGRNPKTGEPVDIPAKTVPSFSASKALKDSVAL